MADKPDSTIDDDKDTLPGLTIDWDLYREYLKDCDLTDDQKREFIETLWNIMVAFVDLGFGIHPVQQVGYPCEQHDDNRIILPRDLLDSIADSPDNETTTTARENEQAATKEES